VNNISAFVVLASGVQGTTVNPTTSSSDLATNLIGVVLALATTIAWVFWVDRLARRRALATLGGMRAAPVPPVPVASARDSGVDVVSRDQTP
jgi:hypothetical protein